MGVATDGVHYVATITWVRTLPAPIDPGRLQAAVEEARQAWVDANKGRTADAAPVVLEPVANVLLVKVALDVERHDVRPVMRPTRSAERAAAPDEQLR